MARRSRHITDRIANKVSETRDTLGYHGENSVPGPSTNPSTNLIINDILLRSVGRLARMTVEKAILGKRYGSQFAKDAVENRSLMHTLTAYGVTKVATRSIPGAALVTGGLLAKTLFDRSKSLRASRRAGDKALREQGED